MKYKFLILLMFISSVAFAREISLDDCFKNSKPVKKKHDHLECLKISENPKKAVAYEFEKGQLTSKQYFGFTSVAAVNKLTPKDPDFFLSAFREKYFEVRSIKNLSNTLFEYYKTHPELTIESPPDALLQKHWNDPDFETDVAKASVWKEWKIFQIISFLMETTGNTESIPAFSKEVGPGLMTFIADAPESIRSLKLIEETMVKVRKSKNEHYYPLMESERAKFYEKLKEIDQIKNCNSQLYAQMQDNASLLRIPNSMDDEVPPSYFLMDLYGVIGQELVLAKNSLDIDPIEQEEKNKLLKTLNIPPFAKDMLRAWALMEINGLEWMSSERYRINFNLVTYLLQETFKDPNPKHREMFSSLLSDDLRAYLKREIVDAYIDMTIMSANIFITDNIPCVL